MHKMVQNAAVLAKIEDQYETGKGELSFGLDILPRSITVTISMHAQ